MVKRKICIICFLFTFSAIAADCKEDLNIGSPQPIWDQVLEGGRAVAIRASLEDRGAINKNLKSVILVWVKRIVQLKIFEEINLKNDQVYVFPLKAPPKKGSDLIEAVGISRTKDAAGTISYTLQNFRSITADQFLEILSELSQQTQSNWVKTKWHVDIPMGLLAYRGSALVGIQHKLSLLFAQPQNLTDLKAMSPNSKITLLRPEVEKNETSVFHAQRFVFYKTETGVIQLLAYDP